MAKKKKKAREAKPKPAGKTVSQTTTRPIEIPHEIILLFHEFKDLGLMDDLIERSDFVWTLVGRLPAQFLVDLEPAMTKKVIYGPGASAAHLNSWLLIDPKKRRARLIGACKARSKEVSQTAEKLLDRQLQTTPILELRKMRMQPDQDPVMVKALSRLQQSPSPNGKKASEIRHPVERTLGQISRPIIAGAPRESSNAIPVACSKRAYHKLVPSIDPFHDD